MKRVLCAVLGLMLVLGLGACFKTGIGDPEKSKVDAALIGAWKVQAKEGEAGKDQFWLVRKFDERAYFVQSFEVEHRETGKTLGVLSFKGWLTTLEGQQFLVLENLNDSVYYDPDGNGVDFFISKIAINKNEVVTQDVNAMAEPLKNIAERGALEKAIAANIGNNAIYGQEKKQYVRATKDEIAMINKLKGAMTRGDLRP